MEDGSPAAQKSVASDGAGAHPGVALMASQTQFPHHCSEVDVTSTCRRGNLRHGGKLVVLGSIARFCHWHLVSCPPGLVLPSRGGVSSLKALREWSCVCCCVCALVRLFSELVFDALTCEPVLHSAGGAQRVCARGCLAQRMEVGELLAQLSCAC